MLFSFIPFFLGIRIAVDENSWGHGPEYVFDVEIKTTWTPMSHDDVETRNNTAVNLICRPRTDEILSCRLDKVRKVSTDLTNRIISAVSEEQARKEMSVEPFEIQFNGRGIEHLIIDEDTCTSKLNTLKSIVELLAIGADLSGVPDGSFETTENSTIGHCNATFNVNHAAWKGVVADGIDTNYELEALPQLNKVLGESIEIQKTKNLDNCTSYAPHYYGTYGESTVVDKELSAHMMSFVSHVFVADTAFFGSASKKASTGSHEDKNFIVIREDITLWLTDVRPARSPLPYVQMPSETSILANSDVKRIFTK